MRRAPLLSVPVYSLDGLGRREDTLKIVNTKNEVRDSGPSIAVDAFEVDRAPPITAGVRRNPSWLVGFR
jgi:hypothetical protein